MSTMITNCTAYTADRLNLTGQNGGGPILNVFLNCEIWETFRDVQTIPLNEFAPLLEYSCVCSAETSNNVSWPETPGTETATGTCVSGTPSGTLERLCNVNGIFAPTALVCSGGGGKDTTFVVILTVILVPTILIAILAFLFMI